MAGNQFVLLKFIAEALEAVMFETVVFEAMVVTKTALEASSFKSAIETTTASKAAAASKSTSASKPATASKAATASKPASASETTTSTAKLCFFNCVRGGDSA